FMMEEKIIRLGGTTPGLTVALSVLRFGKACGGPKAYVQAGLHANEVPGQLCAQYLRRKLVALEADGLINGSIVLVPAANPLGLSQQVNGSHQGRFALGDGVNFNRSFPDLVPAVAARIKGALGPDGDTNRALIRDALRRELADLTPVRPVDRLKNALLSEAIDADLVLDLHCDGEAEMHLYTLTPQAAAFAPLAARLGARALLTADVSGDNPFDEAVSRPWAELAALFPARPIPMSCLSTTVELRGERDVSGRLAAQDADAIIAFLAERGHLAIAHEPAKLPACAATPLAGSEALEAPVPGLILFSRQVGEEVRAGDQIAEIIDPVSGLATPVNARASGVFYARAADRYAFAGKRIGKIAGHVPFRYGPLLSP
ncbi:MAG: succinylglutamate desuccinylase/aspartoacylase family protein, partial [Bosea sp. (in: a-proteobacteria)]